jgi:membrane-bound ClpP family serine protease
MLVKVTRAIKAGVSRLLLLPSVSMATSVPQPAPIPPPQPPKSLYLSFTAKVNDQTTTSLLNVLAAAIQQGTMKITLMLSTPGGSVMHGMTLYNYLTALPVELVTYNIGNVDSIGAIVFLAG